MGDTTEESTHEEEVETSDEGGDESEESTTEDESDTSENSDDEESDDDSEESETDDDSEDDEGKGDSDDKSSDTAEDDTEEFKDDGEEPRLRKPKKGASNKEWAAWRAQQKKDAKKESGDSDESDQNDDTEDSDEELSDEDAAAIDKRIDKAIAPFRKAAAEQEVETEIANFLQENPDFKPFEAKVKRWANHPNREGVPVESIFYEVAGPKLMQMGAKRAQAAAKKANKTKGSGGDSGGDKGSKSYADMDLADFGKELEAEKLKR
jgi:hypothetical protein